MNRLSIGCQPVVNRGFCSSIGLHRTSLVRASGESFRRRVFDALESAREARLLGEQFCWHPVLPDPAPPPRRAPRPDPPVVCPGFGLNKNLFPNEMGQVNAKKVKICVRVWREIALYLLWYDAFIAIAWCAFNLRQ